jgi:hypothetical protein
MTLAVLAKEEFLVDLQSDVFETVFLQGLGV